MLWTTVARHHLQKLKMYWYKIHTVLFSADFFGRDTSSLKNKSIHHITTFFKHVTLSPSIPCSHPPLRRWCASWWWSCRSLLRGSARWCSCPDEPQWTESPPATGRSPWLESSSESRERRRRSAPSLCRGRALESCGESDLTVSVRDYADIIRHFTDL